MSKNASLFAAVAVLVFMSGVASARATTGGCERASAFIEFIDDIFHISSDCGPTTNVIAVQAPEIDPVSAISAITLLLGGLVVLRARKSRA
jgi:hypothetical protein